MKSRVDGFIRKAKKWQPELKQLRAIVLDCGLTEEFKWHQPCYTVDGKNVVILHGLKDSCALGFFQGALVKDAAGIMTKPGENTQAGRWIKFTSAQEIVAREEILKDYIRQAAEAEKAGLKVQLKKTSDYKMPAELQNKFKKDAALKTAFRALTPGRQRGYIIFISAAKQSKTREARIEKCIPKILKGKGFME